MELEAVGLSNFNNMRYLCLKELTHKQLGRSSLLLKMKCVFEVFPKMKTELKIKTDKNEVYKLV